MRWLAFVCAASLGAVASAASCDGERADAALGEPIVVRGGTFHPGALPGSPPIDDAQADAGAMPVGSHLTALESANNVLRPGESGKVISGRATTDASSIGVRFLDVGSGFWVVPVDAPDPGNGGELTWSIALDVARDAPPGLHTLLLSAIDDASGAGTQSALKTCITAPIPDNLNACDPTIAPPFAVVSLAWDSDVDLDLVLGLPDGRTLDAKHVSTAHGPDGGAPTPDPKKDGLFDRDSNAGCSVDGLRREDVVWQSKPAPGTYLVYARLFSACSLQATRFRASLSLAEKTGASTWALTEKQSTQGEVLASDATGGDGLGLYVTSFNIE